MKTIIDYYSRSRPEIASLVPPKIRTILDIGCGEGNFLKLVKELTGANTWGIEMESEIAEKIKYKADNMLIGKVEDLLNSIPNDHFDCITFNDSLEHLINPWQILKMIKIKLTRDGIVIASIPNFRYFLNLYEILIKKDLKYVETGILDSTHLRFFTKKSMKRLFEETGYELIKQKGIFKISMLKFRIFNIVTLGIFNDTKYLQFVCIARVNNKD